MWLAITYLCLILPLLSSAYLVDDVQQSAFETLLKDNKLVLAAFTSKSLVSLTPFRNIFERAAAASKTPFLHIDCAQETDFCKQHDIHAYPAIRLYKTNESGDATETRMKRYRGPKTENAYVHGTTR
jgi:protein disulfide-isomerase A1